MVNKDTETVYYFENSARAFRMRYSYELYQGAIG